MNHEHDHDCGDGCTHPGHQAFPGVQPHEVLVDPAVANAPAAIGELANACVRFVTTMLGTMSGTVNPDLAPDFTPETLSLLDYYVQQSRASLATRPEALPLGANTVGAYLGEVVRRQHRCWWRTDDADPMNWRLDFEAAWLSFYPMQIAYALLAVEEDADDQFSGFDLREEDRDEVATRLAELPPVSEEEYLLPSTRLEVLDITLETLIARQVDDPLGKRALRPEDYE